MALGEAADRLGAAGPGDENACDARAREPSAPEVQVIGVRPLSETRRTRTVLVHVVIGPVPVVVVLAVARLRRQVVVRPPLADDGKPAIGVSPELWGQIKAAALDAVEADPAARAYFSAPRH
jgi:hypothetical protein